MVGINAPVNFIYAEELLVSIIITTYNRVDALRETLKALSNQTIAPDQYEILVADDGSTDGTSEMLAQCELPCVLKAFRAAKNGGISAGRNLAIPHARGTFIIFVSDDLIVPASFIQTHLDTREKYPGCWVVGGFQQLDSLTETPFGRYLDDLEKYFEEMRKSKQLGPNVWEMTYPTARNLSMRRSDFELTGLFDEQFRSGCEDQDLAHQAMPHGIKFIYNDTITSLHNDQAGDFKRYCRTQQRFAHDTVFYIAKYPTIHGNAPLVHVNNPISSKDSLKLKVKKIIKRILIIKPATKAIEIFIALAEKLRLPEALLYRFYEVTIGIYIFRGWREGLESLRIREEERKALTESGPTPNEKLSNA